MTALAPTLTRRRVVTSRIPNIAALTLAALFFLYPFVWLTAAATKSTAGLIADPSLLPSSDLLANFVELFTRDSQLFARWLFNALLYAGVSAAVGTLFSAMAGVAFSKYRFFGREKFYRVVLVGVLIPPMVLALPLFLMFSSVGLTNTPWAVLLPSIVSPFGVYLARIQADAAVPDELMEAGRLDGAGELRIFFTMILRLMRPGLVTLFLFQFAANWNNFLLPLVMLSDQRLYPVTLGLYTWRGQYLTEPNIASSVVTGSVVAVVPVLITFLVLERYLRSGATAGSVKG